MKTIATVVILFAAAAPAFAQDAGELLREAQELMRQAEQLLHASDSGRALQAQVEVIRRLDDLLQKAREDSQRQQQQSAPPLGSRRTDPTGDVSKFRLGHEWGRLSPTGRSAVLDASRNDIPPEFLEAWNEYSRGLAEGKN